MAREGWRRGGCVDRWLSGGGGPKPVIDDPEGWRVHNICKNMFSGLKP